MTTLTLNIYIFHQIGFYSFFLKLNLALNLLKKVEFDYQFFKKSRTDFCNENINQIVVFF